MVALDSAAACLRYVRQKAIERGSLEFVVVDPPQRAHMFYLIQDFSAFVESYARVNGPIFSEPRSRVKLRDAIQQFEDVKTAWAEELKARGVAPSPKVEKRPLTPSEVTREVHRKSGDGSVPQAGLNESQHFGAAKFSFVKDAAIKKIVERDYGELCRVGSQGLKSRFILSGGIIEGLLLDALLTNSKVAQTAVGQRERRPLEQWGLSALLDAAVEIGLISTSALAFGHSVREYRNLVHPGLERRSTLSLAPEEVEIAEKVLEIVIRDLSR